MTFRNITLRKITNAPSCASYLSLDKDLDMKTIEEEATIFYKSLLPQLENHRNPLISALHTPSLPGNLPRRLKRDLLIYTCSFSFPAFF